MYKKINVLSATLCCLEQLLLLLDGAQREQGVASINLGAASANTNYQPIKKEDRLAFRVCCLGTSKAH
jgi:hypothetical protein